MPRVPRVTIPVDVWVEITTKFDSDPFSGDGKLGDELARSIAGAMNVVRSRLMYDYNKKTGTLTFQIHYDRPGWSERSAKRAFLLKDVLVTISTGTNSKREALPDLGLVESIRWELAQGE